ncbi:MAG: ABC transporter permease [Thermoanaerobaculia bacterium]
MRARKIRAIIKREYVEHIRRKAFWIFTILLPVMWIGFFAISIFTQTRISGTRRIAVIDPSGKYLAPLKAEIQNSKDAERFALVDAPIPTGGVAALRADLKKQIEAKKIDGYLLLDPESISSGTVAYRASSVSDFSYQEKLEGHLNRVLLEHRLLDRGIPAAAITDLVKTVSIDAKRADEKDSGGFLVSMVFFLFLYATLIMYGMYNLRGVIEEKSNRIVEIVISSVRPTELMLGKIIGIGLVGLTQYAIWSILAMNLALLSGSGIAAALGLAKATIPTIPMSTLAYFVLFFVLGYFFYASIYTAIGAPFNTDQEAQQLAMIPTMMIVSVWAFWGMIVNNPNSTFATVLSMIPPLTPMVMFFRVTLSPVPAWQVVLASSIMVVSIVAMAWFAGKIYRVGILMYGKKPTVPEILRWMRHSDSAPAEAARPL